MVAPGVIFATFLRLGLTSFGGPVAHLGFYHAEFVERRRWLSEQDYADLVALAQFLPGPASSQVGFATGYLLGGWRGALLAWAGFTLPSVLVMVVFALLAANVTAAGWLVGLKVAAVAIVAQAVAGMWAGLVNDQGNAGRIKAGLALGVAALVAAGPESAAVQILALLVCGAVGWRFLPAAGKGGGFALQVALSRRAGLVLIALALLPLLLLPLLRPLGPAFALTDTVYRAGALVFGGGHVVLPLLQAGLVPDWMSQATFTAGYGVANAVPGPLFTFASYLGAAQGQLERGWGALLATIAIFWPGLLLMLGALPFWSQLTGLVQMRRVVSGLNAGVVGLLLAALYQPVWTSAVYSGAHFALVLLAYAALTALKLPAWATVLGCALVGQLLWPQG